MSFGSLNASMIRYWLGKVCIAFEFFWVCELEVLIENFLNPSCLSSKCITSPLITCPFPIWTMIPGSCNPMYCSYRVARIDLQDLQVNLIPWPFCEIFQNQKKSWLPQPIRSASVKCCNVGSNDVSRTGDECSDETNRFLLPSSSSCLAPASARITAKTKDPVPLTSTIASEKN